MKDRQELYFDSIAKNNHGNLRDGKKFSEIRTNKIFTDFVLKGVKKGATLLEVGCGKGAWTYMFLKMGYKVIATDISLKSLEELDRKAKNWKFRKNLKLLKADALESLNIKNVDVAYCVNVLHHVNNPHKVVCNMVNTLKKGGRLVVFEPNPLNLWWWTGARLFIPYYKFRYEYGVYRCSPISLINYFLKAGLKNIEIEPQEFVTAISPDRFKKIIEVDKFLSKMAFFRYFGSSNLVSGYK